MSRATFSIDGDRQSRALLKSLGPVIRARILEPALRKAMAPVLDRAVQDAPKDTGNLAHHIELVLGARKGQLVVDVRVKDVPYAAAEEFGTRDHPAEHYMLRALDEQGPRARDVAVREILANLERQFR
jgi:HK97 gp10 family phage protein